MKCGTSHKQLLLDARRTLKLAIPLMLAQLLTMGNGLVDALVAGRLGRLELAAGGIGAGLWFFASLSCIGLMAGISPTLSQLIGQRRRVYVGSVFTQGLWIGLITGVVAMLCAWLMVATLPHWSLRAELLPLIKQYLLAASFSLPAFAVVMACRNACEATGYTRGVVVIQLLGLSINIFADLALGLGWFGFPKLGLLGIGIATSIVSVTMATALVIYLRGDRFSRYQFLAKFEKPRWIDIKPMLVLSIPIYLALLFEAGLFVATAVQMGMLGTLEAGAHNIAIGISGACYMLPLGLSFALTARVGRVYGRGEFESLKLRLTSGVLITLLLAVSTVTLLVLFRYQLTGLYTDDAELRKFATGLIALAAVFQLSDGAQVALLGMLRGMNDTRVPMLINAFSYWAVAFAAGYYSAHHLGWGATGLWFGLILGLTVAAVLLAWRLKIRMQQVAREFSREF